jgi:hypothetical protein
LPFKTAEVIIWSVKKTPLARAGATAMAIGTPFWPARRQTPPFSAGTREAPPFRAGSVTSVAPGLKKASNKILYLTFYLESNKKFHQLLET